MKIIITGPAEAFDDDTEEPVDDPRRLAPLDGLDFSTDKCSNYLGKELDEIGLRGGVIRLAVEKKKLRVVTEFESPRKLTPAELAKLVDDTRGQWSDGIGEGEFRHAQKYKLQIDVSPFGLGPTTAKQIADGKKVATPRGMPLHKALEEKKVKLARELLASGVKLDVRDKYGQTPLHIACSEGLLDLAEEFIQAGADVRIKNKSGATALESLCVCQEKCMRTPQPLAVLKLLLKKGVAVDDGDKQGVTPLMWAVNRGHLELVKGLIKAGANVNAQDREKGNENRVLMYASDLEIIKLLLKHGADPRLKNAYGNTAWDSALLNSHQRGYRQRAELLQKHGEKLDKKEKDDEVGRARLPGR
ncbi:ankyrin repeat domain-containing protein [Anatilimnocola floriformis]|uniref:ankyrin repeat domain-containing protein n=1 Tax=Anatilimnocola floriformis TaxID=2948575 RepID=UPI0020C1DFE9|nr:ankyrin repeat domain-containing protein [Anatilimnocola floriformis]